MSPTPGDHIFELEDEQWVSQLVSLMPAGVYACDAQGRIRIYNRRAAELWGYEPRLNDEVQRFCACFKVFMPDGTLVPPERTPMAVAVREGRSFRDVEAIVERPDGSRFTASVCIDPIRDADGCVTGAINVFDDVSERKRTELALRESEQRFARFMRHLPGLAWIKDLDGRYVYANDAAARAFKHPHADLYGKTDHEVFPKATADQYTRNDRKALADSGVELIETLDHPDGVHHSLVKKFPIPDAHGKPALVGGIAIDVTRRIEAEAALQEAKESAEAANRAKDRFLAVLSHELRTPLMPVLMWVSMMERDPALPAAMREDLAMVRHNVELETKLINELLAQVASGSPVELPASAPSGRANRARVAPGCSDPLSRLRVLVVEDHADTADMLARLLRSWDFHVHTVGTAADGLGLIADHRFDLIVSDLGLPDMSGYELMQRVRQAHDTKGIAMSGFGMEHDIRRSREAGFSDHIVKPVNVDQLETAIRRVIARGRPA